MEFKGTKGDWELITEEMPYPFTKGNTFDKIKVSNRPIIIGKIYATHKDEQKANAQLISAAPELLEALVFLKEMFVASIDSSDLPSKPEDFNCFKRAEEAINKALGK